MHFKTRNAALSFRIIWVVICLIVDLRVNGLGRPAGCTRISVTYCQANTQPTSTVWVICISDIDCPKALALWSLVKEQFLLPFFTEFSSDREYFKLHICSFARRWAKVCLSRMRVRTHCYLSAKSKRSQVWWTYYPYDGCMHYSNLTSI